MTETKPDDIEQTPAQENIEAASQAAVDFFEGMTTKVDKNDWFEAQELGKDYAKALIANMPNPVDRFSYGAKISGISLVMHHHDHPNFPVMAFAAEFFDSGMNGYLWAEQARKEQFGEGPMDVLDRLENAPETPSSPAYLQLLGARKGLLNEIGAVLERNWTE